MDVSPGLSTEPTVDTLGCRTSGRLRSRPREFWRNEKDTELQVLDFPDPEVHRQQVSTGPKSPGTQGVNGKNSPARRGEPRRLAEALAKFAPLCTSAEAQQQSHLRHPAVGAAGASTIGLQSPAFNTRSGRAGAVHEIGVEGWSEDLSKGCSPALPRRAQKTHECASPGKLPIAHATSTSPMRSPPKVAAPAAATAVPTALMPPPPTARPDVGAGMARRAKSKGTRHKTEPETQAPGIAADVAPLVANGVTAPKRKPRTDPVLKSVIMVIDVAPDGSSRAGVAGGLPPGCDGTQNQGADRRSRRAAARGAQLEAPKESRPGGCAKGAGAGQKQAVGLTPPSTAPPARGANTTSGAPVAAARTEAACSQKPTSRRLETAPHTDGDGGGKGAGRKGLPANRTAPAKKGGTGKAVESAGGSEAPEHRQQPALQRAGESGQDADEAEADRPKKRPRRAATRATTTGAAAVCPLARAAPEEQPVARSDGDAAAVKPTAVRTRNRRGAKLAPIGEGGTATQGIKVQTVAQPKADGACKQSQQKGAVAAVRIDEAARPSRSGPAPGDRHAPIPRHESVAPSVGNVPEPQPAAQEGQLGRALVPPGRGLEEQQSLGLGSSGRSEPAGVESTRGRAKKRRRGAAVPAAADAEAAIILHSLAQDVRPVSAAAAAQEQATSARACAALRTADTCDKQQDDSAPDASGALLAGSGGRGSRKVTHAGDEQALADQLRQQQAGTSEPTGGGDAAGHEQGFRQLSSIAHKDSDCDAGPSAPGGFHGMTGRAATVSRDAAAAALASGAEHAGLTVDGTFRGPRTLAGAGELQEPAPSEFIKQPTPPGLRTEDTACNAQPAVRTESAKFSEDSEIFGATWHMGAGSWYGTELAQPAKEAVRLRRPSRSRSASEEHADGAASVAVPEGAGAPGVAEGPKETAVDGGQRAAATSNRLGRVIPPPPRFDAASRQQQPTPLAAHQQGDGHESMDRGQQQFLQQRRVGAGDERLHDSMPKAGCKACAPRALHAGFDEKQEAIGIHKSKAQEREAPQLAQQQRQYPPFHDDALQQESGMDGLPGERWQHLQQQQFAHMQPPQRQPQFVVPSLRSKRLGQQSQNSQQPEHPSAAHEHQQSTAGADSGTLACAGQSQPLDRPAATASARAPGTSSAPSAAETIRRALSRADEYRARNNARQQEIADREEEGWTLEQVQALQVAYFKIEPTHPNFWCEVARHVHGKTAAECFNRVYASARTRDERSLMAKLLRRQPASGIPLGGGDGGKPLTLAAARKRSQKAHEREQLERLARLGGVRAQVTDENEDEGDDVEQGDEGEGPLAGGSRGRKPAQQRRRRQPVTLPEDPTEIFNIMDELKQKHHADRFISSFLHRQGGWSKWHKSVKDASDGRVRNTGANTAPAAAAPPQSGAPNRQAPAAKSGRFRSDPIAQYIQHMLAKDKAQKQRQEWREEDREEGLQDESDMYDDDSNSELGDDEDKHRQEQELLCYLMEEGLVGPDGLPVVS